MLFSLALAAALGGASPGALAQKADREASAAESQLNEVGKGERLGRQGLKPGRQAVQAWLARNQGADKPCLAGWTRQGGRCVAPSGSPAWRIGVAMPVGARLDHVPPGLLAALPPAPPGNIYALVSARTDGLRLAHRGGRRPRPVVTPGRRCRTMFIAKELFMRSSFPSARALALVLAAAVAAAPALAAPPEHAGGGKHGNKHADKDDHRGDRHGRGEDKHGRGGDDDRRGDDRRDPRPGAYFSAHDRDAVRHFYASSHKSCPPGLAKKNNGCMPPARPRSGEWATGCRPAPSSMRCRRLSW